MHKKTKLKKIPYCLIPYTILIFGEKNTYHEKHI